MYKSSLFLAVLLFIFPSNQLQAQSSNSKTNPGWTEQNPEARKLYDDGMSRLEMGQVSEALERFQQAVKIDPEYAEAYSGLGRAYFKLRQWENAVGPLRQAMALKAKREQQNQLQKDRQVAAVPRPIVEPTVVAAALTTPPQPPKSDSFVIKISPPKLNRSLPDVRINTGAVVADSELKLPQPPNVEPGTQANVKFDTLPDNPPPELFLKAEAPKPQPPPAKQEQQQQPRVAPQSNVEVQVARNVPRNVPPPAPMAEPRAVFATASNSSPDEVALANIYRVGSKDVLDVRLSNSRPQQTTVFMVTEAGLLEHPQLSKPLPVAGLTLEEIRSRIEEDLKSQAPTENPKVLVGMLEYASHSVEVNGLVKNVGPQFLKSEAVPLALVLAEAEPLREAVKVTVVREGRDQVLETELSRAADLGFLVHPGDVVKVDRSVDETLYVGGRVKFPGEKQYRVGLTLMQAIIIAGGATSKANVAEIERDGGERTRFDLQAIELGKAPDPLVKPRDRIVVH